MSISRCSYCSKFVRKVNINKQCGECEKQFKEIMKKIIGN